MDDWALLRRYVTEASEEAFGELVRRHVGWMHAAALRQVRDPHLAEDVTQAAFIILARKGRSIGQRTILSGWLLRTVRYTAQNALRMEGRRRRREQEAAMLRAPGGRGEDQWEDVAGALEPAVAKLGQADRDAIALRFYERLPQAQVATALGISEAAAAKRVARAVDRLREALGQNGFTFSAAALSGLLTTRLTDAAPAGLASSIASAVAAGHSSSAASSIAGLTLRAMGLVKVKVLAIAAAVVLAACIWPATAWMKNGVAVQPPANVIVIPATAVAEKAAVLEKVQTMRAVALAAVKSGGGTAQLEVIEEPKGLDGLSRRPVEFIFSGNDSLVRGGPVANATAVLMKGGQMTRYWPGSPGHPAPPSVSILPAQYAAYSPRLETWSFAEIARIPLAPREFDDEKPFFAAAAASPFVTVEQEPDAVRLVLEPPVPEGVRVKARQVVEFDLRHGAMVRHYRSETTGGDFEPFEEWQITWTEKNGCMIPTQRLAEAVDRRGGRVQQRLRCNIVFESFTVDAVRPEELSIDSLGIAAGTPVVDEVSKKQWRYGKK